MENSDTGQQPAPQTETSENHGRAWIIGKIKSYFAQRKARKEKESPTDRAARRTADATWAIGFLTAILAVTGIVTCLILRNQLSQMRNDERPWLKVTPGEILVGADRRIAKIAYGVPAEFQLKISNTGKTPAQNIVFKTYVDLPPISSGPRLECVDETVYCSHQVTVTGTIFPDDSFSDSANTMERGQPRPITDTEASEWTNGHIYAAVYGIVTYDDVFGGQHWTKFCFWDPGNATTSISAMTCAQYSETDKPN